MAHKLSRRNEFSRIRPLILAVENLECRILFNNTPVVLSHDGSVGLMQDWSSTALFANGSGQGVSNNWNNVPGIIGYQGQDGITGNGAPGGNLNDPTIANFTADWENNVNVKVPASFSTPLNPGTTPATMNGTATETAGELAYFNGSFVNNDSVVGMQGSGTADFPNLILYVDSTNADAVNVSFNARDIDASTDNAQQQIVVQYRIGDSGSFTNVTGGWIQDATTGPSVATLVTPMNVTLPGAAAHQSQLEIRIMTANATGNDEFVGIDDINVHAVSAPGSLGFSSPTYTVQEDGGNALVTVTRSQGLAGAVHVNYATSPGSALAGSDFTTTSGTLNFADGQDSASFMVPITDDNVAELTESFTVTLSVPTGGASLGTQSTATVTIYDNDGTAPTGILLNELDVNPPGSSDGPNEYVELLNSAGTSLPLNDIYFLSIEGDATSNPGNVTYAKSFSGSLNSNQLALLEADSGGPTAPSGTLVFQDPTLDASAGALQNGTNTFLIVYSQTPITQNTDLDPSNSGTLTLPSRAVVLDAVGWQDASSGSAEGTDYYVDMPLNNAVPGAATRILGNTTPLSASAWYWGDLFSLTGDPTSVTYDPTNTGGAFPAGGKLTPGDTNYVGTGNTSGQISFSTPKSAVVEHAGSITLTVTRNAGTTGQVSVDYTITDGTAMLGQDYNDPSDYLVTHGTITFNDGDTSKTITIPIIDNSTPQDSRTFTVTLTNPQNLSTPGSNLPILSPTTTDTVTIADDDTVLLLNEVISNVPGADNNNESIELKGTPGQLLHNVYIVHANATAGTSEGNVFVAFSLNNVTVGSNGLVWITSDMNTIPPQDPNTTVVTDPQLEGSILNNGGTSNTDVSYLVVLSPTPIVTGGDVDTNNDGNLDLPAGATLVDGYEIYVGSGSIASFAPLLEDFGTFSTQTQAATRILGDNTPLNAASWYWGELTDANTYDQTAGNHSSNMPAGAVLTRGAANFAPDTTPPTVSSSSFNFNPTSPTKQNITIQFSEALQTVTTANLALSELVGSTFTVPSANMAITQDGTGLVTITFPGYTNGALPDGRYELAVSGVKDTVGNTLATTYKLDFFFQNADADRSGTVGSLDLNAVATNFGKPGTFTQGDFNYSGTVDIGDFNLLAAIFGKVLPASAPPVPLGALFATSPIQPNDNLLDVLD